MILIVTHALDRSTYDVLDWLDHMEAPYLLMDASTPLRIKQLALSDAGFEAVFEVNGRTIEWKEIQKVWYRRSQLRIDAYSFDSDIEIEFDKSLNLQLQEEQAEVVQFLWEMFRSKSLNNELDNRLNKLTALNACRQFGIPIPPTLITSDKSTLKAFLRKEGDIITKNCTPGLRMGYGDYYLTGFTSQVDDSTLAEMGDGFFPSLFQKMVEKAFEVRSFYMDGQFYSSCILSQNDRQTQVDFRNYNSTKPNRTPPYQIPEELEQKLRQLMETIQLNCGSIDLLVDRNGKHYFLEVNPVGQFAQVSFPCNYYLEQKIAQYLAS